MTKTPGGRHALVGKVFRVTGVDVCCGRNRGEHRFAPITVFRVSAPTSLFLVAAKIGPLDKRTRKEDNRTCGGSDVRLSCIVRGDVDMAHVVVAN